MGEMFRCCVCERDREKDSEVMVKWHNEVWVGVCGICDRLLREKGSKSVVELLTKIIDQRSVDDG